MSFEFNEQQNINRQAPRQSQKESGVTGKLIKLGIAKDVRQANLIQIGIIVFMLLVMALFMFGGNDDRQSKIDNTDPATGLPMEVPN